MHSTLLRIAAAATLVLAGAAPAAIATANGNSNGANLSSNRTRIVHSQPYLGAGASRGAATQGRLAATPADDICSTPEPSKLGLLRNNQGIGSKIRVLCRKLKA